MAVTVAIQGERGSFSEEAARKMLGPDVRVISCDTFAAAFRSAARGRARYCLVPVENALAGSVYENYDLLLKHKLYIHKETLLRIAHHLIAFPGTTLRNLRVVYSHPVALAQCAHFLDRRRKLKCIPFYDTAGSVKMLAEQRPAGAAAIAGRLAARNYKGRILKTHVEDDPRNFTRFLLLSKSNRTSARARKTSVVFSTAHRPGSLFDCLRVFAGRGINLTKIDSRPLRGRPWEYFFYLDFLGNAKEARCRAALKELKKHTDFLRVLGCYETA